VTVLLLAFLLGVADPTLAEQPLQPETSVQNAQQQDAQQQEAQQQDWRPRDTLGPDNLAIEGLAISHIEFVGARDEDVDFLRHQIDLEPGYLYSKSDVSRAVVRLYSLGRFEDVRVHARNDAASSVTLIFELLYPVLIGSTRFSGVEEPDLQAELQAVMIEAARFDEVLLGDVARRCQRYFTVAGYPEGRCDIIPKPRKNDEVLDLHVQLIRGIPLRVREVVFTGKHPAPIEMLQPLLQLKPTDRYVERILREDERALRAAFFERGFLLANVRSEAVRSDDGKSVRIQHDLEANRRVVVHVQGNQLFKDEDLIDELKRAPDERLFPATLDEWRRRVLEKYRRAGWHLATARIEERVETKRDILHYVLMVEEHERVEVSLVSVEGSKFFSGDRLTDELLAVVDERLDVPLITRRVEHGATRDLLDGSVGGSQDRPASGVPVTHPALRTDTGKIYDADIYQAGIESIRNLYIEQGFTEVAVGPLEIVPAPDNKSLAVRLPVREGPQTLIADISIVGALTIKEEELREAANLRVQQPLTDLALEEAKLALLRVCNRHGHLYAKVEETTRLSSDKTLAFVTLQVSEGEQVRVGRVLVQGNKITNDSVIRDRLALVPGEPYSDELAQRTKENLFSATTVGGAPAQIEAFESAQVALADPDVPAERKDVIVKVVERKPQSLDFGLGISTGQGAFEALLSTPTATCLAVPSLAACGSPRIASCSLTRPSTVHSRPPCRSATPASASPWTRWPSPSSVSSAPLCAPHATSSGPCCPCSIWKSRTSAVTPPLSLWTRLLCSVAWTFCSPVGCRSR
jgi:outer membrane protein assembly factor BamA